jgi:hypothetical protein
LAGVLRAFEPNSPLVIDAETMRCALSLAPYLTAHYGSVEALIGDDDTVELAQRIDAWFRRKRLPRFSRRDAFNGVKNRTLRVEAIDPSLSLLEDRCRIRLEPAAWSGRGRPPSPTYLVNPALLQTEDPPPQNPHNPQNSRPGGAETGGGS